MAEGDFSEPVKCRKQWNLFGFIMFGNFLMAAFLMSYPVAPWMSDEPNFVKFFCAGLGVFWLLMVIAGIHAIQFTSLYVCEDGLGVQFGKEPIKFIHWANVDRASERYPNVLVTTLCFRLKSYGPWLSQFNEAELRRYWSRGAVIYALFGWGYIDRKLTGNDDIKAEIAAMPPQSLQRKIAQRMLFNSRKQNGIDLGFASVICTREDMEKIEASYRAWVTKHSSN